VWAAEVSVKIVEALLRHSIQLAFNFLHIFNKWTLVNLWKCSACTAIHNIVSLCLKRSGKKPLTLMGVWERHHYFFLCVCVCVWQTSPHPNCGNVTAPCDSASTLHKIQMTKAILKKTKQPTKAKLSQTLSLHVITVCLSLNKLPHLKKKTLLQNWMIKTYANYLHKTLNRY